MKPIAEIIQLFVGAVIGCLVAFGLNLSDVQQAAVMTLTSATALLVTSIIRYVKAMDGEKQEWVERKT